MTKALTPEPPVLLLLSEREAAAALGVSQRTFQDMRDEPWMPRPVQLGPRLLKWPRFELEQAITKMPRQEHKGPPVRQRIEQLKAGGAA